ncbi:YfaP family protein [Caballeronia sp. M1242]|uniref:YfaP family protein n=1 Tax=Caballeronia sp. M1242 TaxID=2814653 RepID=UPI0019CFA8B2|nr:tetratricopeptide repeat protein [Caballeronia sp. M1242]QSN63520.1 tetratricopeptide repeat protein [Caballeronia sp. M1242]
MIRSIRRLPILLAFLSAAIAQAAPAPIQVLSATVRDQKISGAAVFVQNDGAQSIRTETDAQGAAPLPDDVADSGSAMLIIKKTGYSDLVVKCPCAGLTYAMSPVMKNLDGMRVVLTWGATPRDLDLHVSYPRNHVYYARQQGTDANLDIDHTDSFGPETITLERRHQGETYVFAVHDFSDQSLPHSSTLSNSQAKVYVYVGQSLVRTFSVPREAGNLWTVFRLSADGEIQDINSMRGVTVDASNVLGSIEIYNDQQMAVQPANEGYVNPVRASDLNKRGEAAYRSGDIDTAIALYTEAIGFQPEFGQAYSNLGLAFQKAGRPAEAMWANRKAIALASGPTAATVRASSHYNIGRIFEDAGQYADALTQYRAAKNSKANAAYDASIARVGNR